MKRKICIATASRAEYGIMRCLIQDIKKDPDLTLQLIVTGTHLSPKHGLTYKEICDDGLEADELIHVPLDRTDKPSLVKAMANYLSGMADALERLKPDILVVLGDRYELLPICSAAVVMNIPIAHISGGDITEGAIDDQIRHAVTKLAFLHFPGNEDSAKRIIQMGENPEHVFTVGEPGLDAFHHIEIASRADIAKELDLSKNKNWILLTYHPETTIDSSTNQQRIQNLINFFSSADNVQIVATGANADCGGNEINKYIHQMATEMPDKIKFIMNLGHKRYIQLLHHVFCIAGNSSSAIIEAPMLNIPVLNIGDRQKGRFMDNCIVSCDATTPELEKHYALIRSHEFRSTLDNTTSYYGDGHATERIIKHLKSATLNAKSKVFLDIESAHDD